MDEDKLAQHRGKEVTIRKHKTNDCSRCDIMEKVGEMAWLVEVLSEKAKVTPDELAQLFKQAKIAVSTTRF